MSLILDDNLDFSLTNIYETPLTEKQRAQIDAFSLKQEHKQNQKIKNNFILNQ